MIRKRLFPLITIIAFLVGMQEPVLSQAVRVIADGDPVFVGAGDIAACSLPGDEATAKLIAKVVAETNATVFTVGDNVYPSGTEELFKNCYNPSWGRFKTRTRPALGNHDYAVPWADPYFAYFGRRAGPPRDGYYSFNLGAWHIISLN